MNILSSSDNMGVSSEKSLVGAFCSYKVFNLLYCVASNYHLNDSFTFSLSIPGTLERA